MRGEINVMSWWKMGVPAFATGSAHMSDAQAKIIREYADEVVMFLDPDKAGETGIWGYEIKDGEYHPGAVEKLSPFMRVRIAAPHTHDANDLLVSATHEPTRVSCFVRPSRRGGCRLPKSRYNPIDQGQWPERAKSEPNQHKGAASGNTSKASPSRERTTQARGCQTQDSVAGWPTTSSSVRARSALPDVHRG
jgi:hypothetical protein